MRLLKTKTGISKRRVSAILNKVASMVGQEEEVPLFAIHLSKLLHK